MIINSIGHSKYEIQRNNFEFGDQLKDKELGFNIEFIDHRLTNFMHNFEKYALRVFESLELDLNHWNWI